MLAKVQWRVFNQRLSKWEEKSQTFFLQSGSQSLIIAKNCFFQVKSFTRQQIKTDRFERLLWQVKQEPFKTQPRIYLFFVCFSLSEMFNYTIKGLYWSKHTEWSSSTEDNSNKISVWLKHNIHFTIKISAQKHQKWKKKGSRKRVMQKNIYINVCFSSFQYSHKSHSCGNNSL